MKIHLHKNAKTTPAQRAFIQNNKHVPTSLLAEKLGVSQTTVRKWKKRSTVFDKPHRPRKIVTALTKDHEVILILIRLFLRSSLDDLLNLAHTVLGVNCSRATLNRFLSRYGISRLKHLKSFGNIPLNDYKGTCLFHSQLFIPNPVNTSAYLRLHLALDTTTRWVYARIYEPEDKNHALDFIFTVMDRSWTNVLAILSVPATGLFSGTIDNDVDDQGCVKTVCKIKNIRYCRAEPYHVDTLSEFKNSQMPIAETSGPFSFPDYKTKLRRLIEIYNKGLRQKALKQMTPQEALLQRYQIYPGSFNHKPNNLVRH